MTLLSFVLLAPSSFSTTGSDNDKSAVAGKVDDTEAGINNPKDLGNVSSDVMPTKLPTSFADSFPT